MRCDPANSIIKLFGGLTAVSIIADVSVHSVMRWRMPKKSGGTGGAIPHWHIPALLEAAQAKKIELTGDSFLPVSIKRPAAIEISKSNKINHGATNE